MFLRYKGIRPQVPMQSINQSPTYKTCILQNGQLGFKSSSFNSLAGKPQTKEVIYPKPLFLLLHNGDNKSELKG